VCCSSRPFAFDVGEQVMLFKIIKYKRFQWLVKRRQALGNAGKSCGVESRGAVQGRIWILGESPPPPRKRSGLQ
jgi:hypothetical protein